MATLFSYMSWNHKHFSGEKLEKDPYERKQLTFFKKGLANDVKFATLNAKLIREVGVNVVAIMEGTKTGGEAGKNSLVAALDLLEKPTPFSPTPDIWDGNVSDPSADGAKGDLYITVYKKTEVSVTQFELAPKQYSPATGGAAVKRYGWLDRHPAAFQVTAQGSARTVTCFLWHAPQPQNIQPASIERLALWVQHTANDQQTQDLLVSGDFNLATDHSAFSQLTTNLGFQSLFPGELTSLAQKLTDERWSRLSAGDTEAYLASAYDNIFVHGVGFADEVKTNLPVYARNEMRQWDATIYFGRTTNVLTRLEAHDSLMFGHSFSDHCPVSVTIIG